ncbi:MAG: NADH-quinone oxidoreductase subunit C, partial [Deltaproteobacteria bacterium]|nr:NADH-quinone oxidoreductase subunit C [Deltaproteobacteria bacterium]
MAVKKSLNEALLVDALKAKFGESILDTTVAKGEVTHTVDGEKLPDICAYLKDDSQYRFNFLTDMHATDNNKGAPRFEVVYHLYSIPKKHRLRL